MTSRPIFPRGLPLFLGLCLPIVTACSEDEANDGNVDDASAGSSVGETGSLAEEGGDGDGDSGDWDGGSGDGDGDSGDGDGDGGGAGDSGGDGGDGDGDGGTGGVEPGQLTGGEWRDLDHWDFWLALGDPLSAWFETFDKWGFDTRGRVPVLVLADGQPAVDAPVLIRDSLGEVVWSARTDNEGHAELWPELLGSSPNWPMSISSDQVGFELAQSDGPYEQVVLELPSASAVTELDLMFVVDTTSSMSDELTYLQAELGDVISRVDTELGGNFGLRMSVNFYRDVGDQYLVRSFPFTSDIPLVLSQLEAQSSAGGGDIPEAVEAALEDAIFEHDWSVEARARLLFLILDAPPHDTADIRASLETSIRSAAEQGIRVIPVAASGIDKDTEFLLRNIDIATGGTYTFLTSDSGIGGEHLEPTIGEYTVELLNDLLVRLITEAMI